MRNSPVHAMRQLCRISDRRGFMVPTVANTGSGAEFGDRLSLFHGMADLAYCWVALPIGALNASQKHVARKLASGDRVVRGIDLSSGLLIWQHPDGLDPRRQSGRDRHSGFPKWIWNTYLESFA